MFIRSPRLFLRPAFPEDRAAIHAIAASPVASQWAGAQPIPGSGRDGAMPRLLVTLPGSSGAPVIGGCGLAREHGIAEIGYWIAPPWRGNGFATEAVRALLEIAAMLGHELVAAVHFLDSPASARVLRKTGFRATGEIVSRISFTRGASAPAARHVARPHDLVLHSETAMVAA